VAVTLTAGNAGTAPLGAGAGGAAATGTLLLPPLERRTGTATRATMSAAATGHRRFSRRSAIRLSMKWVLRLKLNFMV
jgi:hypothetical protein